MREGAAFESDAAGQRITLKLMPNRSAERQDLLFERRIIGRRQKVGFEDEPVALERRAIVFGNQGAQPPAAPFGHWVSQPHARDMQSGAIERGTADHRIVAERFLAGCQSSY